MLRDDSTVAAETCSASRLLLVQANDGFFIRDGCCNTGQEDVGSQTVCAVMTSAFLDFSGSRGNDLSTPGFGIRLSKPEA
jgi:uncharacterized protein (DUF2237 family)